jgi:PilZ domain
MVERKRFPKAQLPCRLKIGSAPEFLMAHTENVGPGGIRVYMAAQIPKGMPVKMEVFLEQNVVIKCKGFVVWAIKDPVAEKTTMDKYDIGIQFDCLGSPEKQKLYELVEKLNYHGEIKQAV